MSHPKKELLPRIMATCFALARNRKVHFIVASLGLLLAVFHTFGSRGVSTDDSREGPIKSDWGYHSALEIISRNMIVTDIHIQRCLRGLSCRDPELRTKLAIWEKVPTKLNLFPAGFQMFNYFMYVEKSPTVESDRFVTDITFTLADQQPETEMKDSKFLVHKISPTNFVWIQYMDVLDFKIPIVRDVNVFYGNEDMRDSRKDWEFEPSKVPIPGKYLIHAKISMLKVSVVDEIVILQDKHNFDSILKKNEMFVTSTPKFKIMQLSDMHIGQDTGACFEDCKYDIQTLEFLESAIRQEGDVQLIVITGDMIDSVRTTHYESVILKALSPILMLRIPFIFTFGDSDYKREDKESKINILNFIASLPGCYNKNYADLDHRLHGMSNGNLKVYRVQASNEDGQIDLQNLPLQPANALVTYLDSEDKMVGDSQANYVYRVNHKQSAGTDHKLLFLHYPLPNFRPHGTVKLIGTYNEKHALVTDTDKKFLEDIKASGYKVVAVGHEHENDACIWEETGEAKVLLCYSGVTGESGLTRLDPGYKRRLRVFELDFENGKIYSWKRDQEKAIDPQEIWSA